MQDKMLLIYELKHNRILNKQNISLGFFSAFALTIFAFGNIPIIIKTSLIAIIVLIALIFLIRSSREIDDVIEKIKNPLQPNFQKLQSPLVQS